MQATQLTIQLAETLQRAHRGDRLARERLIEHYRPYILNCAGKICKRFITWSDEEASIGLIAFNKAIDTFNHQKGKTFQNYSYLLIKRDLIDHFRQEQKQRHLTYRGDGSGDDPPLNKADIEQSLADYAQSAAQAELVDEILAFSRALESYAISFEELEDVSPKHNPTRHKLDDLTSQFLKYPELIHTLTRKKRLPTGALSEKTGYHRKLIERHRKYIIALLLIKLHPEWVHLTGYLSVERSEKT